MFKELKVCLYRALAKISSECLRSRQNSARLSRLALTWEVGGEHVVDLVDKRKVPAVEAARHLRHDTQTLPLDRHLLIVHFDRVLLLEPAHKDSLIRNLEWRRDLK